MILVTGATGFIGRHLIARLVRDSVPVRAAVCTPPADPLPPGVEVVAAGDLREAPDWRPLLAGVDAVVHLAGLAHAADDPRVSDDAYEAVNASAVRHLAAQAAVGGVRAFVFLSSSKVLGEESPPGGAWTEETAPDPHDAYGRSKLRAEQALLALAGSARLRALILRPPVVYGPGVRANILELFGLVARGVPLPLGAVRNCRSLLYVGNLVDAVLFVLRREDVPSGVYHVSDGDDVSTAELVRRVAAALHRRAWLVAVPPSLLALGGRAGDLIARLSGGRFPLTSAGVTRLTAWHVLDGSRLRALGWRPSSTMAEGLRETARWYARTRRQHAVPRAALVIPAHLPDPLFKRPLDVVLALLGIAVSLPLWIVFALWIRLEDWGPVFFPQIRIGRAGRPIRVLKFRSMRADPRTVEVQAQRADPRITRVGRVLRRTALDELPQLWNILIGDMSFVGPRAQPEREVVQVRGEPRDLIMRDVPGFALRQLVRPGLTGIAQLYAPREVPHRQKFRYDLIYVKKFLRNSARDHSALLKLKGDLDLLWLDTWLVLRSVWIALRGRWEV